MMSAGANRSGRERDTDSRPAREQNRPKKPRVYTPTDISDVPAEFLAGREEVPGIHVTIDGSTSRDLDDAIGLETLGNGDHIVHVNIADVPPPVSRFNLGFLAIPYGYTKIR